ncbi:uncharacterized protein UTRI_03106 [Ustilago trichophora]|uniref:Mig1 protein n=1 Tax=Ustilago trichophora TaxID=86804 RepID=A0A5C3E884_9BASI|nr:uncharacterized protein UTRI_03106 [Ustilago trichophora]
MTIIKLFTIVLLGASIMLAEGHVTSGTGTTTLERRDFASCAKAKIDTMWKNEKDRPKGASAAICFSGHYEVSDPWPHYYLWVGRLSCKEKHGLITYKNRLVLLTRRWACWSSQILRM